MMEFNVLVKSRLLPLLQMYGFEIAEEFTDILRFQSFDLEIDVVYNKYERSCNISLGKKEDTLLPLNDHVVNEYFNSPLSIDRVSPKDFVENLYSVFKTNKGSEILYGNIDSFLQFKLAEISDYNNNLMLKQTLETASKAWDIGDYATFIDKLDTVEPSKIPKSFQRKYHIAKQKRKLR